MADTNNNDQLVDQPPMPLPDQIDVPAIHGVSFSGKYIAEHKIVHTGYEEVKGKRMPLANVSLEGDARFDRCMDFSKQLRAAIKAKNPDLLPADAKDCAAALFSENLYEQESAVGFVSVRKITDEYGPYDTEVAGNLQGIDKASREYQRRIIEFSNVSDKLKRIKAVQMDAAADEYNKINKEAEKNDQERYGALTAVQYTKDYGKGTKGPGLVCLHTNIILAPMMDGAGFPSHIITCYAVSAEQDPGFHLSCISDVTGNIIEGTTPAGQDPYLINVSRYRVRDFADKRGGDIILSDADGNINTAYSTKYVHIGADYDKKNLQNTYNLASKNFIVERIFNCQNRVRIVGGLDNYLNTPITKSSEDARSNDYKYNPKAVKEAMYNIYLDVQFANGDADPNLRRMQEALSDAGALKIIRGEITAGFHPDLDKLMKQGIPVIAQGDLGHADGAVTTAALGQYYANLIKNAFKDGAEIVTPDKKDAYKVVTEAALGKVIVDIDKTLKSWKSDSETEVGTVISAQASVLEGGIKTPNGRAEAIAAMFRADHYIKQHYSGWDMAQIESDMVNYSQQDINQYAKLKALFDLPKYKDYSEKQKHVLSVIVRSYATEYASKYVETQGIYPESPEFMHAYDRGIDYITAYFTAHEKDNDPEKMSHAYAEMERKLGCDQQKALGANLISAGDLLSGFTLLSTGEVSDLSGTNPMHVSNVSQPDQQNKTDKSVVK